MKKIRKGDQVCVRGRFLQTFSYDILKDNKTNRATIPVIVADSFTRLSLDGEGSGFYSKSFIFVIGFGVVFLLVLFSIITILNKGNSRFDAKMKELRGRRGKRKKGA